MDETPAAAPARRPSRRRSASTPASPPAPAAVRSDFSLGKALFEIAIVAVGVLLALIVDEARQSRSDSQLAAEARSAMRAEIEQNRVRLATKLALLHSASRRLDENPGAGPELVASAANFQVTLTDGAWVMATQTGALRLLSEEERQALSYVYNSQGIYNQLLAEEMRHWTDLAASGPGDPAVKLWKAYAQRVAVGACIATIRIERFRNPRLGAEPLRRACLQYRPPKPPAQLYRELGIPMPKADWRPGGEF